MSQAGKNQPDRADSARAMSPVTRKIPVPMVSPMDDRVVAASSQTQATNQMRRLGADGWGDDSDIRSRGAFRIHRRHGSSASLLSGMEVVNRRRGFASRISAGRVCALSSEPRRRRCTRMPQERGTSAIKFPAIEDVISPALVVHPVRSLRQSGTHAGVVGGESGAGACT